MTIHAYDLITGNPSDEAKQKCKIHVKISKKYIEKHGLLKKLNAAVGLACILLSLLPPMCCTLGLVVIAQILVWSNEDLNVV